MLAYQAMFSSHQLCTCEDHGCCSSSMHVQVLRLHSTSASPDSPPVDHASGIEAMILAILQQANYSQQAQLDTVAKLVLQLDETAQEGLLLDALPKFFADARTSNALVQARLGSTSAPSLIPASPVPAVCMQRWHCLHVQRECSDIATSKHYFRFWCCSLTALIKSSSTDRAAATTEHHSILQMTLFETATCLHHHLKQHNMTDLECCRQKSVCPQLFCGLP